MKVESFDFLVLLVLEIWMPEHCVSCSGSICGACKIVKVRTRKW